MARNTLSCTGLVLKYRNTGETDRFVTLLTQEQGKVMSVAKGVRRLNSSRSSSLEPGNLVKCTLIGTKSMPILSQALLLSDAAECRTSLPLLRKLYQLLEILDRLFVEEEIDVTTYRQVRRLHAGIITHQMPVNWIRTELGQLIDLLGFEPNADQELSLLEHVAHLTGKPLRSYEYLLVKNT